jgi:nitrogen fixation/metabolism regulation signal transduction histidine kinase
VLLNLLKNAAEAIDNGPAAGLAPRTSSCAWCRATRPTKAA